MFGVDILSYRYHFSAGLVNSTLPAYVPRMNSAFSASGDHLADMIVYLARLGQSPAHAGPPGGPAHSLTAAQWTALRYFARANRFSRTPSAFSDFHATTRGTASQTVKSMVALGLLARQSHATDGRSTLIEVTAAGRQMLQHDPLRALRRVLEQLDPTTRRSLSDALDQAVARLAQSRDAPVFGSCADCSHCQIAEPASYCHCTQSLLTLPEMGEICVDFLPNRRPA